MKDEFIVVENTPSPDVSKILSQAFKNATERNSKGVENGYEIAMLAEEIRLWDRHQNKHKEVPATSVLDLLIVTEVTTSSAVQNGLQQAFKKAAERNDNGSPNGIELAALAKQIRLYERAENKQKRKAEKEAAAQHL